MPAVLVVDDEPAIRALIRATLERAGYGVLEAADGAQALRLAAGQRPALVLLDMALPRVSGLETCRQLKANAATAHAPVLFLTGLAQPAEAQAAREAGAVGCISKPFQPERLVSAVAEALRRAPVRS